MLRTSSNKSYFSKYRNVQKTASSSHALQILTASDGRRGAGDDPDPRGAEQHAPLPAGSGMRSLLRTHAH